MPFVHQCRSDVVWQRVAALVLVHRTACPAPERSRPQELVAIEVLCDPDLGWASAGCARAHDRDRADSSSHPNRMAEVLANQEPIARTERCDGTIGAPGLSSRPLCAAGPNARPSGTSGVSVGGQSTQPSSSPIQRTKRQHPERDDEDELEANPRQSQSPVLQTTSLAPLSAGAHSRHLPPQIGEYCRLEAEQPARTVDLLAGGRSAGLRSWAPPARLIGTSPWLVPVGMAATNNHVGSYPDYASDQKQRDRNCCR